MNVALLGSGKTGRAICELHDAVSVFNTQCPPSLEALKKSEVVISFLPGQVFKDYIPLLVESRLPVVTGSTGGDWRERTLASRLKRRKLKWIWASNFSLGMTLVREMIRALSGANRIFQDYFLELYEVHHTEKLDSPSGTALSWKEWLGPCGENLEINSDRKEDVVGIHELTFATDTEEILLTHEAKDRSVFAEGALWSAKKIVKDKKIGFGLHHFSEIMQMELAKKGGGRGAR